MSSPTPLPTDMQGLLNRPGRRWTAEERRRFKKWVNEPKQIEYLHSVAKGHSDPSQSAQDVWMDFSTKHIDDLIDTYEPTDPHQILNFILYHFKWFYTVRKPGSKWTEKEIGDAYSYFTKEYLDRCIKFAHGFIRRAKLNGQTAYELAKDVVHDKAVDAFKHHLHTYDPERYTGRKCPFLNWFFTIVARKAVRASKREENRQKKILDKFRREREKLMEEISMPGSKNDWGEIEPYLDRVSPLYQEALEHCLKLEMPRAEAAEKSRWPCNVSAMKVRLHRARKEVSQVMEQDKYVNQLPTELRQAYILIVYRRLSLAESAKIAGCSEDEMEDRIRCARQGLKQLRAKGG